MALLSKVILCNIAVFAAAKPLYIRQNGDGKNDRTTDAAQMCESHTNLAQYSDAAQAWDETGAGVWMDLTIDKVYQNHESGWLGNMQRQIFPENGPSSLDGCLIIGGDCRPNDNCTSYVTDRGNGMAFWVLKAVKGLHDKVQYAHEQMQNAAIVNGLQVDAINSDFQTEVKPAGDILRYFAAAMTMAAGIATGARQNEALRGGFALVAGAFTTQSIKNGPDAPISAAGNMKQYLIDSYRASSEALADILRIALGGEGNTRDLPYQSNAHQSHVANFFADGVWLVENDNKDFRDSVSEGNRVINQKLVDIALDGSMAARLIGDLDIGSREDCTGRGKGHLWLNANGRDTCFYMTAVLGGREGGIFGCNADPFDCAGTGFDRNIGDGFYDKITKYNINLETYYKALIDCAVHDRPKVDVTKLPLDGSVPRCFFNLPTRLGRFSKTIGSPNRFEDEGW